MISASTVVDKLLEGPVITSFTSLGYNVRKRVDNWTDLDDYDLSGRTIAITGGTSGLGLAAAGQFARCGAHLILLGRSEEKTNRVRDELLVGNDGAPEIDVVLADMGDLPQVRDAAARIVELAPTLDVLIHNAGALAANRQETSQGIEQTVASQVVGPHLLTTLLLEPLLAAAPGRVLTMSSGGMYTAGLTVNRLQMDAESYGGSEQYARAKRAQATLTEMWAELQPPTGVVFHALHPGWADTPGVESALPTFYKVMGPLLRDPLEGADTLVWLAADDGAPIQQSGGFWLDRRQRSIHKLPTTRKTDTPERRVALWNWVQEAAGLPVN